MKTKKRRFSGGSVSVRWRIFALIIAFGIFALLTVWIFQVRLNGYFYGAEKKRELERLADEIQHLEGGNRKAEIYRRAAKSDICVRIMRMVGPEAVEAFSCHVIEDCVLHNIDDSYISLLFNRANNGNGQYFETKTRKELYEGGYYDPPLYLIPESGDGAYDKDEMKVMSAMLLRIMRSKNNEIYFVMLNAKLTPVSTVGSMIASQYFWIMNILIFGALLFTLLLSKYIADPVEKMNETAKSLAVGEYNVHFPEKGFSEARELAETLNYAAGELSRSDKLQKEILANVSHDLRTPLTMIKGYGEMMRDIPGENTPENIQVVIDEANRLGELVSALLDLSKLRAGASPLETAEINMTETVKEVMHRYAKLTEHLGYRIEFYSDGEVFVNANRNMIVQVLYNLMSNGIKHIGSDRLLIIYQSENENRVRISVSDHGEGIPADRLGDIWSRYYKSSDGTEGAGIGLSIVKSILEAHKAPYGVISAKGRGSTFWFEFDIVKKSQKPAENKNKEE